MMAQIDILLAAGRPYMHARGVSYMAQCHS
jgi:hypothetical protein